MVLPHGIKLATHLISAAYGDLCSKVCECLLRRGTLNLAQIILYTELTKENVVNCLRVLIHHNCVQAFVVQQEGAFGEAPRIITQYMALFSNMIHKLRAPKFMEIVSEELDEDCLGIFHRLIQHGRLSMSEIIERNKKIKGDHVVKQIFNRLLHSRFVERCPAPEPFLDPPAEDEGRAKKRGAKSAKIAGEQLTTEQRALAAAAPMESMRFLMESDDVSDVRIEGSPKSVTLGKKRKHVIMSDEEISDADIKKEVLDVSDVKIETSPKSVTLGKKRNHVMMSDEELLDIGKKKEVFWRVNFEELVCRLRHKACISYVKSRINNDAAVVLSAIFAAQKAKKSAHLSIDDIHEEMIKTDDAKGMDFESIRVSLDQLGCQAISTEEDESYSTDVKGIIGMAQNDELESVVLRRYGTEAYRIFRLLSKAGRFLETDKISDTTFVEKKDTLNILYKLWKDDYVDMEKVTTSAARQSLFQLWKVNKELLFKHVLDEMYHSALNLRLRMAREQDQGKEVIQLPKEKLVGELEKKYKFVVSATIALSSSLMNLDDAIMLFHDF